MFLLNSCLSLFSADYLRRHPFSRSYGVILPNSLTMLLQSALGSSPHPPESVYGTGLVKTIAAFLGSPSKCFATLFRSLHTPGSRSGFSNCLLRCFDRSFHSRLTLPLRVPTSSVTYGCRNLNLLSIDYVFRPRLRSRLTQGRSALPWNP